MSGTNFNPRLISGFQTPTHSVRTQDQPSTPTESKTKSVAFRVFSAIGSGAIKVIKGFAVTAVFVGHVMGMPLLLPFGLGYIIANKILSGESWKKVAAYTLSIYFCQLKNALGLASYRWSDKIDDDITLGGLPLQDQVKGLQKEKIAHVISMNEGFELKTTTLTTDPVRPSDWEKHNIRFTHYPSEDFLPVPLETIERAVDAIHYSVQRGEKVYIHCKAGVGRSATTVACYYVKYKGMNAQEAIDFVKKKRPSTNLNKKQLDQIYRFEAVQKLRGLHDDTKKKIVDKNREGISDTVPPLDAINALNEAIKEHNVGTEVVFDVKDLNMLREVLKTGVHQPVETQVAIRDLETLTPEHKQEILAKIDDCSSLERIQEVLQPIIPAVQWSLFDDRTKLLDLIKTHVGNISNLVDDIRNLIRDGRSSEAAINEIQEKRPWMKLSEQFLKEMSLFSLNSKMSQLPPETKNKLVAEVDNYSSLARLKGVLVELIPAVSSDVNLLTREELMSAIEGCGVSLSKDPSEGLIRLVLKESKTQHEAFAWIGKLNKDALFDFNKIDPVLHTRRLEG